MEFLRQIFYRGDYGKYQIIRTDTKLTIQSEITVSDMDRVYIRNRIDSNIEIVYEKFNETKNKESKDGV